MIIKSTRISAGDYQRALDYIVRNSVNEDIIIQSGNPEILAEYCDTSAKAYQSKKYTLRHFIIAPEKTISEDMKQNIRDDLLKEFKSENRPFVHATHRKKRKDGSIEEHEHIMIAELDTRGRVLTTKAELALRHKIARRYEVLLNEKLRNSRFNKVVIEHEENPEIKAVLQQNLDENYYRAKTPYTQGQYKKAQKLGLNLHEIHQELVSIDKTVDDEALLSHMKSKLNEYDIEIQAGQKDGFLILMMNEEVITSIERIAEISTERMNSLRDIFDNNPDATPPPTHEETKKEKIMEDEDNNFQMNSMFDFTQSSMQIKIDELHNFLAKSRVPKNMSENEKLDWINGRFDLAIAMGLIPQAYPQPNQVKEIIKEKLHERLNQQSKTNTNSEVTATAEAKAKSGTGNKEEYRPDFGATTDRRDSERRAEQDRSSYRATGTDSKSIRQANIDDRKNQQRELRNEKRISADEERNQSYFKRAKQRAQIILSNVKARLLDNILSDKNVSEESSQKLEDSQRLLIDMMTNNPVIALHLKKFKDKFEEKEIEKTQLISIDPTAFHNAQNKFQDAFHRARSLRASYGYADPLEGTVSALRQEMLAQQNYVQQQQLRA